MICGHRARQMVRSIPELWRAHDLLPKIKYQGDLLDREVVTADVLVDKDAAWQALRPWLLCLLLPWRRRLPFRRRPRRRRRFLSRLLLRPWRRSTGAVLGRLRRRSAGLGQLGLGWTWRRNAGGGRLRRRNAGLGQIRLGRTWRRNRGRSRPALSWLSLAESSPRPSAVRCCRR